MHVEQCVSAQHERSKRTQGGPKRPLRNTVRHQVGSNIRYHFIRKCHYFEKHSMKAPLAGNSFETVPKKCLFSLATVAQGECIRYLFVRKDGLYSTYCKVCEMISRERERERRGGGKIGRRHEGKQRAKDWIQFPGHLSSVGGVPWVPCYVLQSSCAIWFL